MTPPTTLAAFDREITVEPIIIGGQDAGAAPVITGNAPPNRKNWWPWIIGGAVLVGLWYLTREEGRRGPLGE